MVQQPTVKLGSRASIRSWTRFGVVLTMVVLTPRHIERLKHVSIRKSFFGSLTYEPNVLEQRWVRPHCAVFSACGGSGACREAVDRNLGGGSAATYARTSQDLPQPNLAADRAHERRRDESENQNLEYFW